MKLLLGTLFFLILSVSVIFGKLHVAVIGGGIGGTSAAYFLNKIFDDEAEITLFEASAIGGRLKTVELDGKKFEAGGAILIPRNRYISQLLEELGLKKRKAELTGYSALYDGKEIIFAENEWKLNTISQLVWRYGLGLYYLNSHIGELLNSFDRIYSLQSANAGYENVTALLAAMNPAFTEEVLTSSADGFRKEGFSTQLIDELVAATLRVNYGQSLSVHKFVGSVSVAGAGGGLWAVEGGNKRVPELLAEKSGAQIVRRPVESVTLLASGKMAVAQTRRSDIPPEDKDSEFDAVIIAAPQTEDMPWRIRFNGFPDAIKFGGAYHRTVCTLIRGQFNNGFFSGAHSYTDEILTTTDKTFFNSVGRVYPVDTENAVNNSDVWKVFSQRPLSKDQLSSLFTDIRDVQITDWLAYPHYGTTPRLDKFVLSRGLYHINAIEWAASAMEMSLVGAKNVANLIRNDWCKKNSCPVSPGEGTKEEL